MKMSKLVLPLALLLMVVPAVAQDSDDHEAEGHEHGHDHGGGEMNAEMEAWAKLANPNAHHQHLAQMEGTWDMSLTMWMQPGAAAMESTGTSTNEMIMGGRYLQSNIESTFMGQPFHGQGLDGYDNQLKKHVGMWIDTASTMMMQFVGECSDNGKVLNNTSEFQDPTTGKTKKSKTKITLLSDDEFTYESWYQGPDGEFFQNMKISYKRKS